MPRGQAGQTLVVVQATPTAALVTLRLVDCHKRMYRVVPWPTDEQLDAQVSVVGTEQLADQKED